MTTSVLYTASGSTAPEVRHRRLRLLADRMTALPRRDGSKGSRDRWLLVVGGCAMPLGLLLIALGWYGTANTVLPFEQMPYLISGGLLGIALVTVGGFLYFAYWLTLGVRESRLERQHTEAHQRRVEGLLQLVAEQLGAKAGGSSRTVITEGGTMLHRSDCVVTAGQTVHDANGDEDFTPCGLCRPAVVQTRKATR